MTECKQEADKCNDARMKSEACNDLNNQIISDQKHELIQLIERDAISLTLQLNNLNLKSIKESEINKEEIDKQLLIFDGFARYCQAVVDKATPSELVRLSDMLHSRARELQDMTLVNAFPSSQVKFSPSNIVDVLTKDELNIVGQIGTDVDRKTGLNIH